MIMQHLDYKFLHFLLTATKCCYKICIKVVDKGNALQNLFLIYLN